MIRVWGAEAVSGGREVEQWVLGKWLRRSGSRSGWRAMAAPLTEGGPAAADDAASPGGQPDHEAVLRRRLNEALGNADAAFPPGPPVYAGRGAYTR